MDEIAVIVEQRDLLGESPLWHPGEQALYWIDIKAPALRRLDPATGMRADWALPQEIGSIALRAGGGFVAGLRDGFATLTPGDSGAAAIDWIVDPEAGRPDNRLNDGKCDRQGRFWAGSFHDPAGTAPHPPGPRPAAGVLYRLAPDRTCTPVFGDILVSNSLCWSPDGTVMYFADSPRLQIRAWDYDPATGDIAGERIFAQLPEGRGTPDGSTVDAEGFLWNAVFRGSRITRYAPDGSIDREIAMPVERPTCCAFGGPDLATLFVTSARFPASAAALATEPLAGALFAIDCGVAGLAETPWPG